MIIISSNLFDDDTIAESHRKVGRSCVDRLIGRSDDGASTNEAVDTTTNVAEIAAQNAVRHHN